MTPERLLRTAAARGLACIAVTDHGCLRGARECARLAARDPALPRVIPGEEIRSTAGEIIGLYLVEEIPGGLSPAESVARIREQGGVALLPHPFDDVRRAAVRPEWREPLARLVDVVEVWNGRLLRLVHCRQALELAARVGRPFSAGSDAHFPGEVGRVWLEVPRVPTRGDLLDLLRVARPGPDLTRGGLVRSWWFQGRSAARKARATACRPRR